MPAGYRKQKVTIRIDPKALAKVRINPEVLTMIKNRQSLSKEFWIMVFASCPFVVGIWLIVARVLGAI